MKKIVIFINFDVQHFRFFLSGPWEWNKFLRGHAFDFLGASGNAEVKEAPLYGKSGEKMTEFTCKLKDFRSDYFQTWISWITMQEVRKFGLLIKSTCTNCTWNVSTTPNEEHAMDTMIRRNQGLLTNTAKDFHVTTTTIVGRRTFNFCFLGGGKVGAVLKDLMSG